MQSRLQNIWLLINFIKFSPTIKYLFLIIFAPLHPKGGFVLKFERNLLDQRERALL